MNGTYQNESGLFFLYYNKETQETYHLNFSINFYISAAVQQSGNSGAYVFHPGYQYGLKY